MFFKPSNQLSHFYSLKDMIKHEPQQQRDCMQSNFLTEKWAHYGTSFSWQVVGFTSLPFSQTCFRLFFSNSLLLTMVFKEESETSLICNDILVDRNRGKIGKLSLLMKQVSWLYEDVNSEVTASFFCLRLRQKKKRKAVEWQWGLRPCAVWHTDAPAYLSLYLSTVIQLILVIQESTLEPLTCLWSRNRTVRNSTCIVKK